MFIKIYFNPALDYYSSIKVENRIFLVDIFNIGTLTVDGWEHFEKGVGIITHRMCDLAQ